MISFFSFIFGWPCENTSTHCIVHRVFCIVASPTSECDTKEIIFIIFPSLLFKKNIKMCNECNDIQWKRVVIFLRSSIHAVHSADFSLYFLNGFVRFGFFSVKYFISFLLTKVPLFMRRHCFNVINMRIAIYLLFPQLFFMILVFFPCFLPLSFAWRAQQPHIQTAEKKIAVLGFLCFRQKKLSFYEIEKQQQQQKHLN